MTGTTRRMVTVGAMVLLLTAGGASSALGLVTPDSEATYNCPLDQTRSNTTVCTRYSADLGVQDLDVVVGQGDANSGYVELARIRCIDESAENFDTNVAHVTVVSDVIGSATTTLGAGDPVGEALYPVFCPAIVHP